MLAAILAAANAVEGVAHAAHSLGSFGHVSDRDQARINAAQSALQKAIAGDASALAYMQQQSQNSATQVGKDAFKRALQAYADAKAGRPSALDYVNDAPAPQPSPLQQQITETTNKVRDDVAGGVLNIGTGATNAAAQSIAGTPSGKSMLSIPTNPSQLLLLGAIAVGALLILKPHRAH